MDEQQRVKEHGQKILARCRAPEPRQTPAWVNAVPDKLAHFFIEKHLYKNGEVWGLARAMPDQELPYDEMGSANFLMSAPTYGLFEKVGGWNEQAKQDVIRFWQSWQDPKTGHFHDPRDPNRDVNEKYILGLLNFLGAKPLYPFVLTGADGQIDTGIFLRRTQSDPDWQTGGWSVGSHTLAMGMEILKAIDRDGREDLIPALEKGVEQVLEHQDPASGMWGPPSAPLDRRIGGTLKVVGRLYFYAGFVVPHTRELADSLVRHQADRSFHDCSTDSCVQFNEATMIAYCLEASDYRRDDLLAALESEVQDFHEFVNPDGSISFYRGGGGGAKSAMTGGIGICGAYLHWEDCRIPCDLVEAERGLTYGYHYEVTKDGHVKVVKT